MSLFYPHQTKTKTSLKREFGAAFDYSHVKEQQKKRKLRKNQREKERRLILNEKFSRLSSLLDMNSTQKAERVVVLSEAISIIQKLRKQNDDLAMQKAKICADFAKMTTSRHQQQQVSLQETLAVNTIDPADSCYPPRPQPPVSHRCTSQYNYPQISKTQTSRSRIQISRQQPSNPQISTRSSPTKIRNIQLPNAPPSAVSEDSKFSGDDMYDGAFKCHVRPQDVISPRDQSFSGVCTTFFENRRQNIDLSKLNPPPFSPRTEQKTNRGAFVASQSDDQLALIEQYDSSEEIWLDMAGLDRLFS